MISCGNMLKSLFNCGPVTAVLSTGESILAGVGSHVSVYCSKTLQLIQKFEVLPARVVHGIIEDCTETRYCIFGEKCLRLVQSITTAGASPARLECVSEMFEFPDWIWDVTWLQDSNKLCLALAHNVIVTFDVSNQTMEKAVHCEEKCILYCAKFLTSHEDCLVLAAGTVFNQVVLWSPQSGIRTDGRVKPFHRLTGHQGVIFGIDYRADLGLMCSVSDDRSIRVYRVAFTSDGPASSIAVWETMTSDLLHVLYGHSARVWKARLLTNCLISVGEDCTCCVWSYEGHIVDKLKGHRGKSIWSVAVDKGEHSVITGGGDNSIRLWKLQSPRETNMETKTNTLDLQLEDGDFPRNTRLLDINRVLVITNNGQMQLYNLVDGSRAVLMSDASFSSYTVLDLYSATSAVAIGNIHGTLRVIHTQDGQVAVCTDVSVCEGKIRSLLWLDHRTILATGPDGIVTLWNADDRDVIMIMRFILPDSKQRFVTTATRVSHGDYDLLVCGDRMGSLYVYRLSSGDKEGHLIQTFPRLHGKAGVTHVCCHDNKLFSAGRDGLYRVYSWQEDGKLLLLNANRVCKGLEWIERLEMSTEDEELLVHGFQSDMFVVWSVQQNRRLLEVTCGGGHRSWDYGSHGDTGTVVYVKARDVKVAQITRASRHSIIKSALHGRELCDAKWIGSGQDSNGSPVQVIATCSEDTLVCVSTLHYEDRLPVLKVHHTLSRHISSVRCIATCDSSATHHATTSATQNAFINRKLLFTGGGRAQVLVWRINANMLDSDIENCLENDSPCETSKLGSFENTVQQNENENCSTTSGGSRPKPSDSMQISLDTKQTNAGDCISPMDVCSSQKTSACSHKITYESLAGIQFSQLGRPPKKPWKYRVENSDPETRVLDMTVIPVPGLPAVFVIGAACSDGMIRLLSFNEDTRKLELQVSAPFHDHCVLKVCHVTLTDQSQTRSETCDQIGGKVILVSSATDGKVAFWDLTPFCDTLVKSENHNCDDFAKVPNSFVGSSDPKMQFDKTEINSKPLNSTASKDLVPVCSIDLHQSGINSVHVTKYGTDNITYLLVTGGDDNSVKVTEVTMATRESGLEVKVTKRGSLLRAHSAQITGVRYLDTDLILTASIDQRVCLWKLVQDNQSFQLQLQTSYFSPVSDIANIDVITHRAGTHILISGDGLEVLELDHTHQQIRPTDANTRYLANVVM